VTLIRTGKAAPRNVRVCDLCGQFDDHPRHILEATFDPKMASPSPEILTRLGESVDLSTPEGAQAMASLFDPTVEYRHWDCCKAAGCPDGTCDKMLAAAPEDARHGDALVAHITKDMD
jgi:hypothetical protein